MSGARPVQAYGAAPSGSGVPAAAIAVVSGPAGALPHLAQIQRSFGRHDVRHVQAHVGGPAAASARAMGTAAFATGDHVAFASAPSLHIAAHEAAHVIQQRGGVQLAGGVGQNGDAHEQHANAVADLVVRGQIAESLLDRHGGATNGITSGSAHPRAVQRYGRDEHAALSTTYLIELYEFLKTPAGITWAKDHGYTDPNDLIKRIAADPVVKTNNEPVTPGEARHTAKLHGAKTDFTFDEITAMMGDLFGHWQSLYGADDSQREHLMGEDSTANNEKYTHGEYLKLAAKNTSHFAGENFFPDTKTRERANLQALQYIPWARTQVEQILYANRTEARTKLGLVGGYLVEHNLEAIGDVARERDLLHQQEFDRAHGGSGRAVMSQFEWRFGK